MQKKIVVTYGTFDLFHIGHLRLIERAKEYADSLIVFVSTDEFNQQKGKQCLFPYEQRAEIIAGCRCVDKVFPEHCWEQKIEDIEKLGISTFVMGDDWQGKFDFLKPYCDVIYLPRTSCISSAHIKQSMRLNAVSNKSKETAYAQ